jgi:hypothetical protein
LYQVELQGSDLSVDCVGEQLEVLTARLYEVLGSADWNAPPPS